MAVAVLEVLQFDLEVAAAWLDPDSVLVAVRLTAARVEQVFAAAVADEIVGCTLHAVVGCVVAQTWPVASFVVPRTQLVELRKVDFVLHRTVAVEVLEAQIVVVMVQMKATHRGQPQLAICKPSCGLNETCRDATWPRLKESSHRRVHHKRQ